MLEWILLGVLVLLIAYLLWQEDVEHIIEPEEIEVMEEGEVYPPHPFRDDEHQ